MAGSVFDELGYPEGARSISKNTTAPKFPLYSEANDPLVLIVFIWTDLEHVRDGAMLEWYVHLSDKTVAAMILPFFSHRGARVLSSNMLQI